MVSLAFCAFCPPRTDCGGTLRGDFRCATLHCATNETHYRSRKWKPHIVKQLCLRDCACHYRSRFGIFGEFLAGLRCPLACCTALASSNFRSENVSTMLRAGIDVTTVEREAVQWRVTSDEWLAKAPTWCHYYREAVSRVMPLVAPSVRAFCQHARWLAVILHQ